MEYSHCNGLLQQHSLILLFNCDSKILTYVFQGLIHVLANIASSVYTITRNADYKIMWEPKKANHKIPLASW